MDIHIRTATEYDAESLLEIYSPYVSETAVTFEYDVPSEAEFRERIKNTLVRYPYLVAENNGEIVGYAYAGYFKERAAYDHSAEMSVYVRRNMHGKGIGKALYLAAEKILVKQNILNLNACIAYPAAEDEYLDKNSADFHSHMGYSLVGRFHSCGFKFGSWYDMIWMEKFIGEHTSSPGRIIPFSELEF